MYPCGFCKLNCSKGKYSISCILCAKNFHLDCAAKSNPKVTAEDIKLMKRNESGLVYRCGTCASNECSAVVVESNAGSSAMQLILSKLEAIEETNRSVVAKLTNLEADMKNIFSQLEIVKTDVNGCVAKISALESETNKKFANVNMENDELRRLVNRNDIVIEGLPSHISDETMRDAVMNIANKYGAIAEADVNFCAFIRRKKAVLLKINNAGKRDTIMKNYRKDYSLKLSDVTAININSRIFLNDNYTPLENHIRYLCRDLQRRKEIRKFKVFYRGGLAVKVFDLNNVEKDLKLDKLLAYSDGRLSLTDLLS